MPVILKRPSGCSVPTGLVEIDWSNPLTQGLIGCWLPGMFRGINLVGGTPDLTSGSGAVVSSTSDGPGLNGNTTSSGLSGIAPAAFKTWASLSLFYRGFFGGSGTAFADIFGVTYDNAGGGPFCVAVLGFTSSGGAAISTQWNTGGSFTQDGIGATLTSGAMSSYAATFKVGGNVVSYVNGSSIVSSSFGASGPTTSATSSLEIVCSVSTASRNPNSTANIALAWNRDLSADEIKLIDSDPYCFLISVEGEMPALVLASAGSVGSAAGIGAATAVGKSTAASVGSAAGTGAATGPDVSTAASIGAASGVGAATAIGASTAAAVGLAAGIGSATATGAATAAAVGSATGTGTATALTVGGGVGTAAGIGAAAAVGKSTAASIGNAPGTGAATGAGATLGIVTGVGFASGIGTAVGVGSYTVATLARWVLDISARDDDEDIDFTGAEVALAIKDYDGYQMLSATIGNGLTLTSPTIIQLRVTPDQWATISPGAYRIGAVYRISGATYQIFTGQLTVQDDVATIN